MMYSAKVAIATSLVYFLSWQSVEQIGNRADRMRIGTEELFLYSSTDVEVHASGTILIAILIFFGIFFYFATCFLELFLSYCFGTHIVVRGL